MAITSELIGKLGGADVEVTSVFGSATGGKDSEEVLATINVPSGETWLIAVMGDLTPRFAVSNMAPSLYLGSHKTNGYTAEGPLSMAIMTNQTVTLRLVRGHTTGTDTFAGQVYTVKM